MKTLLKTIIYTFAYVIGKCVKAINGKKLILVLMYHSVESSNWKYGVHPQRFEEQLKYIKQHFNCITSQDIIVHITTGKEFPDNSICLTFDDAYLDTYEVVFPLIKKYQVPITVFVTTDLNKQVKLGSLARPTWAQLKEMADSNLVTLAFHGHTHTNFPDLYEQNKLASEIETSRRLFREHDIQPAELLAYPAGKRSKAVKEELKVLGIEGAFGISDGIITKGIDPYQIPRVQIDRTMGRQLAQFRMSYAVVIIRWFKRLFNKV